MTSDGKFQIVRDIPLQGGNSIKAGTMIYLSHGTFYLEGGLMAKEWQEDFEHLIEDDVQHKYIVRVTDITGNSIARGK